MPSTPKRAMCRPRTHASIPEKYRHRTLPPLPVARWWFDCVFCRRAKYRSDYSVTSRLLPGCCAPQIQIDGSTDLAFTEDVLKRYEAYGWHTQTVADGDGREYAC